MVSTLLGVGACSAGGDETGPAATVGTAPTTSTAPPEPVDPAVIPADPAEIDEDYVQAVIDALYAVDARATEIFVETRDVTDDRAIAYLQAIYVPDELERQLDIWFHDLALRGDELLPGVQKNDVQRVIDVARDCIYVEVESDYSAVSTRGASLSLNYLGLTPKIEGDDPDGLNPTAWMMFMNGVEPDGSEPENPCAD